MLARVVKRRFLSISTLDSVCCYIRENHVPLTGGLNVPSLMYQMRSSFVTTLHCWSLDTVARLCLQKTRLAQYSGDSIQTFDLLEHGELAVAAIWQ